MRKRINTGNTEGILIRREGPISFEDGEFIWGL